MVKQLTDYIYSINIPLPGNPLRNLNSFLIKGENRNLLIDTGFNMPESHEAMKAGLAELSVDMKDTDILLTHLHSDHIGLAPALAESSTKIYMSKDDFKLFKQFTTPDYAATVDNMFLSFGFSKAELVENKTVNPAMIYLPAKNAEYELLDDGRIFDLGTCRLECIITPGHTPGHICVYDRENKIIFSGDHVLFGISPNITSWITLEDSLGSYLENLVGIRALEIERTFSSHREIEGDIKKRIDELLIHHQDRLNEAEAIVVRRQPATVYQVASEMTWSIRAKDWKTFPVAQKWFALGETHSHLEYLRVRNILTLEKKNGLLYYSHS